MSFLYIVRDWESKQFVLLRESRISWKLYPLLSIQYYKIVRVVTLLSLILAFQFKNLTKLWLGISIFLTNDKSFKTRDINRCEMGMTSSITKTKYFTVLMIIYGFIQSKSFSIQVWRVISFPTIASKAILQKLFGEILLPSPFTIVIWWA